MSYRSIYMGNVVYRVSPNVWNEVKGLVVRLNGKYFPKRDCASKLMAIFAQSGREAYRSRGKG